MIPFLKLWAGQEFPENFCPQGDTLGASRGSGAVGEPKTQEQVGSYIGIMEKQTVNYYFGFRV